MLLNVLKIMTLVSIVYMLVETLLVKALLSMSPYLQIVLMKSVQLIHMIQFVMLKILLEKLEILVSFKVKVIQAVKKTLISLGVIRLRGTQERVMVAFGVMLNKQLNSKTNKKHILSL